MRLALLAAFAACFAMPASADLVLKSNDGSQELRLYESKCTHAGTLAHIKEEFHPRFKSARILDRKGTIEHYGCWIDVDDTAFIIFEDGSSTDFSLSKFKNPTI